MKAKTKFYLLHLLFLTTTISGWSASVLPTVVLYPHPLSASPDYGVSNYTITQSVKYNVEINFSLTHKSITNYGYWFKFARLNDRQPNSPLTQFSPPYQESKLLFSNITGSVNPPYVLQDKFNNTYDVFNNTLNYNEKISLNQLYNTTLNEVVFKGINEVDVVYNMSDNMFELYSNNSELYYERNNTALIDESNNIVAGITDPILKAEAIHNWV